jgi:hypothetical protein
MFSYEINSPTRDFYALAGCLKSQPGKKLSNEDIKRLPEILAEIRQKRE